ncbi:hypothetical protein B0H14DRAFT_3704427 [Mycena olivaceomarginata]|nr:hypothetical protein B0H14DRAFT_3704427 [Mycena olivaceomarginata]
MPNNDVDEDLKQLRTEWADNVHVTFKNHREMERSLAAAREANVQFHTERISIDFQGREFSEKTYEIEIHLRDPWEVMKRWVRDESLMPVSTWFSQERYLCLDGKIDLSNPLYEEPCTGTTWREVDDSLPADEKYPSCYLGGHFWLDKGLVSTKVKMHPMLLRGCWIESATRNGSGNGGAALLGFVIMPAGLREIDPKTLNASLGSRSRNGETLRFGDGVTRTAYPGVLIESMDFEELAAWLAIRIHELIIHDLHKLSERSDRCTPDSMQAVLARTKYLTATEREEVLKSYGLQNLELRGMISFITLTVEHGGDMFGLRLKSTSRANMLASRFNDQLKSMNQFPRWRGLKHIPSPTTIDYSEGQTFVDILKARLNLCKVSFIIQEFFNSVRYRASYSSYHVVHASFWLTKFQEVYERHGKDFNFLKQHSLSHAIEDFMSKGTSRNMNTRVGEGFEQEVEKMYQKTNGKNAEHQIALQDENEEAMARIKMAVDEWRRSQEDPGVEEEERTLIAPANQVLPGHWTLGSP